MRTGRAQEKVNDGNGWEERERKEWGENTSGHEQA